MVPTPNPNTNSTFKRFVLEQNYTYIIVRICFDIAINVLRFDNKTDHRYPNYESRVGFSGGQKLFLK